MKQQGSRAIFLFRKSFVNVVSTIHKTFVKHPEAAFTVLPIYVLMSSGLLEGIQELLQYYTFYSRLKAWIF